MDTEALTQQLQEQNAGHPCRKAKDMQSLKLTVLSLLEIMLSFRLLTEGDLDEFVKNYRSENAAILSMIRSTVSEPLVRTGPGGDFTQDFYASDLGIPNSDQDDPQTEIINQEGA